MTRIAMFTSESVTRGHPDKLCDQISDAVVDAFLQQDPLSRVVAECAVSTGILFIAAHVASEASVDVPSLAREVIRDVGYEEEAFDSRTCSVMTSLNELPAAARPRRDERDLEDAELDRLPAADQVTVFGYACDHTDELMPLPIALAHALARRLDALRLEHKLPYLSADGKTQVGVELRDRRPVRIHSLSVVASQTADGAPPLADLRKDLEEHVIAPVFEGRPVRPDADTQVFLNPGGEVVLGGPALHSGLTGRKTGVDTYGEFARQSGAGLSGKDPSRIDRVAAYAARHAAKNVVAAGLAAECEVQLSYAIGLSHPVSVQVSTFGTGRIRDEEIAERVEAAFDLRPAGIVRAFDLRWLPRLREGLFYRHLAVYGQVGRTDADPPWERTDAVERIR